MRLELATPPAEVAAEEVEEEEEQSRMDQMNHTIVIVDQDGAPRRLREPEMGPGSGPGKKRKKTKGTESPLTTLKIDKVIQPYFSLFSVLYKWGCFPINTETMTFYHLARKVLTGVMANSIRSFRVAIINK